MPSRLGKLVLFLPFKEAKKIQIREGKRHLLKSQLNAAHSSGKRVLSSLLILFYIYKKEMPSRLGKLVSKKNSNQRRKKTPVEVAIEHSPL